MSKEKLMREVEDAFNAAGVKYEKNVTIGGEPMAKGKKGKGGKLAKVVKALGTGVKEEMDSMSDEDLRQVIVDAEAAKREAEREADADVKLRGAKDLVKDLGSAYAEVKKAQSAKQWYASYRLEGGGAEEEAEAAE